MNLTVSTITTEVASYYRVQLDSIFSTRRNKELIKYKHIAIYFIRKYVKLPMADIGRYFPGSNGHLDHASVLHALTSVTNQYNYNRIYSKEIDEIELRLRNMIDDSRECLDEVFMQPDFFIN